MPITTDGNGGTDTAVVDIIVASVNDAPVFSNLDDTIIYTPGGAAVTLDADVTIFDPERSLSDNFNNHILRVGPATGDHSIGINGTPANVGDPISINGIVIGTVGSNTLAGAKSFSFNANATNALVNEFMQSLTYEYNGILPPASVDFDWTYFDAGQLNDSGTTTVNFTPNQIPIVDLNGPLAGKDFALTYIENSGLTNIAPDAAFFDANEKDITLLNLNAAGFDTHSNSELVFGGTSVTAGTPSSGTVPIGALTLAYNYDGGDTLSFTNNAGAGEPISTSVLTVTQNIHSCQPTLVFQTLTEMTFVASLLINCRRMVSCCLKATRLKTEVSSEFLT